MIAMIVFPILVNDVGAKWIHWIVSSLHTWSLSSLDEYERQYYPYMYGTYVVHIPIMVIVLSVCLGYGGFVITDALEGMLLDPAIPVIAIKDAIGSMD